MSGLKTKHINLLGNLLFFAVMFVFWRFFYVNHLLYKEQMQLFLLSPDYFLQHLQFQGGIAIYTGEFLTQFFRNPWLAASLMSAFLLLLVLGIQKLLRCVFGNRFFILSYLPSVVYGLLLCNSFYEFSGLVAVVAAVCLVYFCVLIGKGSSKLFFGFIFIIATYWFLGGAYILFVSLLVTIEIHRDSGSFNKKVLLILGYAVFALLLPYVSYKFFITDHLSSVYLSRAFYQLSSIVPKNLIVLLLLPAIILTFYSIISKIEKTRTLAILNGFLSTTMVCVLLLGFISRPDYEQETERKFSILVDKMEWDTIINEAERIDEIGTEGKLALSLALAQNGQMSTRLFEFNPKPGDFFIPFKWQGQVSTIANEPYFYLGLNNFSKMLCNESIESTPNEKLPVRAVKRLVENYIIDGRYDITKRYLWYLENTLFYRKWAKETKRYLYNDKKVEQHLIWGNLRRQITKDDFYFQYERNDIALLTLLRSNQQNQLAYEYLVCWYLLQKDFDEFLNYLPLASSMGYNEFPLVFQEALAYIKTLLDEVPESLEQYPISAQVQQNLNRYAQAFQQGGSKKPADMKKQFGTTYWYYVHFIETENE